jgi:hypothetical protein
MKTKLSILSHESAQATVDEFLPYWRAVTDDVTIFVPVGHFGGTPCGPNAYKGAGALQRFIATCRHLLMESDAELHIIAEYDVLPLKPEIPAILSWAINCGAVMLQDTQTREILPGQLCALPPWIVTRPMLAALIEACEMQAAKPLPDWTLGGLLDRLIGAAIYNGGLIPNNLKEVLSHTSSYPEPHKYLVASGKTWIHGWKRLADFHPIL